MGSISKKEVLTLLKGKKLTTRQKKIRDNTTSAYKGKKVITITAKGIGVITISNSEKDTGYKKGTIIY